MTERGQHPTPAPAAANAAERFGERRGLLALWAGILAGPLAWLLTLQVDYMLVQRVCHTGGHVAFHLVTLGGLLLAAGGGLFAWRNWGRAGREWPDEEPGVLPRSRFMAALGVTLSALFSLVIVAQGIPNFFLDACRSS